MLRIAELYAAGMAIIIAAVLCAHWRRVLLLAGGPIAAIDAAAMHWFGRRFYCRRARHREAVCYRYGALALVCVDCGQKHELGPVYLHGTNRIPRRHA